MRNSFLDLFPKAEALRRVPIFAQLAPSKLKLMAFTTEHSSFKDGEELFQVGELADWFYVILDGVVEILVELGSAETAMGTLATHELVGELAVLRSSPHITTSRARGPVEALRIRGEMFRNFLAENPHEALHVMAQLSEKLIRCQLRSSARRTMCSVRPGSAMSQCSK